MTLLEALRERRRDWRVTAGYSAILGGALAAFTACLSAAWPVLFGPLPFADAGRIVAIHANAKGERGGLSWQDAEDLRERADAIRRIAVYMPRTFGVQAGERGHVDVLLSLQVTAEFLDVLGVRPAFGAPLAYTEEPVVWLTDGAAARQFGQAEQAVHRILWINSVRHRVAGVLPGSFRFPSAAGEPEMILLLPQAEYCCARGGGLAAIARVSPGFALQLPAVSAQLGAEHRIDRRFAATPLREHFYGARATALRWLLAGALCLVWIAAANGSGIWMSRWLKLRRDFTIREALGAPAGRLLTVRAWEGILAGAFAASLGTALAVVLLKASQDRLDAELAWQAVACAFGIAVPLGCLTAILPFVALRRRGHGVSGRVRTVLIACQLAATSVLAWATIAVGENVFTLLSGERGFRSDQVLLAGIGIPESRYNTDEKMIQFHEDVIARLREVPGVTQAAGGAGLPQGSMRTRFLRDGQTLAREQQPQARIGIASADMLSTLGIALRRGRGITAGDRWNTPRVALVNEAFARTFLRGADPLREGLRLSFYNGFAMKPYTRFQVVGVIADTRNDGLLPDTQPQVIIPSTQIALEGFFYHVRTPLAAQALQEQLRQAVWSVDPAVQRITFRALDAELEKGLGARRDLFTLGALLSLLAALIAGAGLYASLSTTILESERELAIRAALGAAPVRLAVESFRWAAGAALFGLIAAAIAVPFVAAGISLEKAVLRPQPLNVVLALAAILLLTLLAALRPLRRASAVAPVKALRER